MDRSAGGFWAGQWETKPRVTLPPKNRTNRLHALGNGQVPQCAATAWSILWERMHGSTSQKNRETIEEEQPPRGCRDLDGWREEQSTLQTAARLPHLRIDESERYVDVAMHMARWWRPWWQTSRDLDAAGAERCRRCDGNGAYNLRRSSLGFGYYWAQCCVCLGYGRVLPEVQP